ncbi:GCG_CRPN prefix-to-repeats domain-containing protein [Mycolicibacterium mucogenicum]|uniref:GCG_CRPN prefix-to-repeats domain-containing protein n=1 Tax=Mycolicibacterium mucogenicum TaxID=56689 RepID=UPI00399A587A
MGRSRSRPGFRLRAQPPNDAADGCGPGWFRSTWGNGATRCCAGAQQRFLPGRGVRCTVRGSGPGCGLTEFARARYVAASEAMRTALSTGLSDTRRCRAC